MRLGAELAVSEINEAGGLRGRRIELLTLDDRGQPATAIQMARRFVDDNSVLAVVGHAQNATTIAAAPVYDSGPDPVVVLSPSASSVELGRTGPRVFRVCPDDVAHAEALADWARSELGARRAATLYHNDRGSRTAAAVFRRAFTERGGTILAEDPFSPALPSFEPYIARAARRGRLEALLVVGGGSSIGPIVAALDSVGSNAVLLGKIDLLRFGQASVGDLEGAILSAAYLPDRGGARNAAFLTAYLQAHGGQRPDHTAAGSYDIVHLIADAIENGGATRAGILTHLLEIGTASEPFEGATGTIAFDNHGNLQRTSVEIGVVSNGVVAPFPER
jgi:branched-chain amino acid transport system substrate-binding protein